MALLPDFWWPFGPTVTIAQNTDPEWRQKGPYSARITGNAEVPGDPDASPPVPWVRADGITTSPFRITPSEAFPHFAQEYALKLAAGKVRAQVWDVTGPVAGLSTRSMVVWPSREAAERGVTDRLNVWIEDLFIETFEDMWRGGGGDESKYLQLALLCEDDSTDFYVDAGQCVNWGEAAQIFYDGRAANDLFAAGIRRLAAAGEPLSRYDISALDLTRIDDVHYPARGFVEGGNALIVAPDVGPLATVTRRVHVVVDDPISGKPSQLTLETNVEMATRRQAAARAGYRRRQNQRSLRSPVPESIGDAVARLTPEQLTIQIFTVPGMHRQKWRLQGGGSTPAARWENGQDIGSENASQFELSTDSLPPDRPLLLTGKSIGPTGLESADPFELTVSQNASGQTARLPIDQDLVLYWPLEEQGDPTLPPGPSEAARDRIDTSPAGNHGYIYTWDFGSPVTAEPGASGYALKHADPEGGSFPSGQVMVDSDPTAQAAASVPDDQTDFDQCTDVTVCGAFRPWLCDPDDCSHTNYDLWGRMATGGGPTNGHVFEEAGFYFGLTEYLDGASSLYQPGLRMVWWDDVGPAIQNLVWAFDWTFGEWDARRGAASCKLQDIWIWVCQRIADDGAGGIDVDVFIGDLYTTQLLKLSPTVLGGGTTLASAYGAPIVKDLTLKTTRWTFMARHHRADDREGDFMTTDGYWGYGDEHRRWNRALSDEEILGSFLDLSAQKPADLIFQVP